MKTIFIVDDNDTNLLMAKQALDGSYRAFALQSAEKMFGLMEKITPDLILLDVEMPVMDGLTALTALKENVYTANIPVIFLTAYISDALEAEALKVGAADFITKPFSQPVLLNRIEQQLKIADLNKQLEYFYEVSQKILGGDFEEAASMIRKLYRVE